MQQSVSTFDTNKHLQNIAVPLNITRNKLQKGAILCYEILL